MLHSGRNFLQIDGNVGARRVKFLSVCLFVCLFVCFAGLFVGLFVGLCVFRLFVSLFVFSVCV